MNTLIMNFKRRYRTGFALLFLSGLISCTPAGSALRANQPEVSVTDANQGTGVDELRTFIDDMKSCRNELCEVESKGWSSADYDWPPTAETVMVIEDSIPTGLILGKYANRSKALLTQSESGEYHKDAISPISVRKGFFKLTRELIGTFANYRPAQTLVKYSTEIEEVLEHDLEKAPVVPHVTGVLGFIGEQSPKLALVFAKLIDTDLLGTNVICKKDFDRIREFSVRSGQSLREQITANRVSVINMSAGHSRVPAERMLAATCPGVDFSYEDVTKYLVAVRPYYELISSIEGVTFVQAGEIYSSESQANSDYSPIDCAPKESMPNRIRVGYFQEVSETTLKSGVRVSAGCFDVLVNLGFKYPETRGVDGAFCLTDGIIYAGCLNLGATSWAAPIMTAHVLYLMSTESQTFSTRKLLDRLQADSMPGILDPLSTRETPYLNEKRLIGGVKL